MGFFRTTSSVTALTVPVNQLDYGKHESRKKADMSSRRIISKIQCLLGDRQSKGGLAHWHEAQSSYDLNNYEHRPNTHWPVGWGLGPADLELAPCSAHFVGPFLLL